MNPALESALNRLPVPKLLRRFEDGTLRISGVLHEQAMIPVGEYRLSVEPGLVRLSVVFQGGPNSFVSKMFVQGKGLVWIDADRGSDSLFGVAHDGQWDEKYRRNCSK